ncbi:hypothetical protein DRF65_02090 [Chryseobacterium pennae]|uniref:Uncharacterized protein n=1 Tax=Chryseobacterium pennae TaxID=2258962 RepID=A0A3D9CEW5_9FLAO|nr:MULTISPECIES: hypothetical protein [Chryseobacterium]MCS4304502.1 hypothetical protein [Chryseobacterium sp. BIGb0232]REC64385.1 hypothetical protein DRF65_02090 [Chryseobacterium pennae]ROS14361.1 hypothetical protein EDF65_3136 [Chryseobacterium nakagawai]
MKIENLDFGAFYYVEAMKMIDDPIESVNEFMKFEKEKTEIELFLKDCSLKDFIGVIITIFKDKYANGALLGALISETIQKEKQLNEILYVKKFQYRDDLKSLKFRYNEDDHFESLEFDIIIPFTQISHIIEESLMEKKYSKNGDKYILDSDSGMEYIEATPTFFKLGANMKVSKKFH